MIILIFYFFIIFLANDVIIETNLSRLFVRHAIRFSLLPALLDYRMRYVFNGNYVLGLGKKMFIASGSRIYYSGLNVVNETIWIPGTLAHPFIVHVSIFGFKTAVFYPVMKFWLS